jgi:predicted transcriptional regulator
MAIDTVTATLLGSVLSSSITRNLFTTIAKSRIAEVAPLKAANPEAHQELDALEKADLIGAAPNSGKYYVTAKGLKVARDLEKLPIG